MVFENAARMRRIPALFLACSFLLMVVSTFFLPNGIVVASATSGDAARGKALFETRCTGCHSLDSNKEGPRLRGVYGRKAGSVADFSYSEKLKAANFRWDQDSLDKWLTNPDAVVPDNDMAFRVANPQERADIIQFLRISSGK
jgi:cytochrome c